MPLSGSQTREEVVASLAITETLAPGEFDGNTE